MFNLIIGRKTNKIMKTYSYIILFKDGSTINIIAMNIQNACIIAMARKLDKAENHRIESIVDEKGNHYTVKSYMDIEKVENVERI